MLENLSTTRRIIVAAAFALFLALPAAGNAASAALPCAGMVVETRSGSDLDFGWAGLIYDAALPAGGTTSWDILKRCTSDQEPCNSDDDCDTGDCVATCDCDADGSCEITGPVHGRKCVTTLADCTTNADCPASAACVNLFGPPIPATVPGSPLCSVVYFEGSASGTFETSTGETSISATLRQRLFFGTALEQPCPRCGPPNQNPEAGDIFTCEGGQFPGAVCTVEGVTPTFGGTSSDCPPSTSSLLGPALAIRLTDLTTGVTTRTAMFPCTGTGLTPNPLTPGSNPKCIDDTAGPVCSSNADCRRCTGDPTIKCSSDGNCAGNGTCAEAPDQPITCGFWCHCGFCDNDGSLPCFENGDCPGGQTCTKGGGSSSSANAPQLRPNDCSMDAFVCGRVDEERCEDTQVGACSLKPYINCTTDSTCENSAAGTCMLTDRPCFESRITRSGAASPLGSYCAFEDKACSSNSDCTTESSDFCVPDASRPQMAATFCSPATSVSPVNPTLGVTGPATVNLQTFARVCRCGIGETGCEEVCAGAPPTTTTTTSTTTTSTTTTTTTSTTTTTTTTLPGQCGNGSVESGEDCDDGNMLWSTGEFCNAQCKAVGCADPNDSKTITTADALFALRSSVGSSTCSPKVCDVNGNGSVTTGDALLILRKSVGQAVTLTCS